MSLGAREKSGFVLFGCRKARNTWRQWRSLHDVLFNSGEEHSKDFHRFSDSPNSPVTPDHAYFRVNQAADFNPTYQHFCWGKQAYHISATELRIFWEISQHNKLLQYLPSAAAKCCIICLNYLDCCNDKSFRIISDLKVNTSNFSKDHCPICLLPVCPW